MNDLNRSASEAPLADDLLEGAAQIAAFLFGDGKQRRRVYWLAQNQSLPVFRIGQSICARPVNPASVDRRAGSRRRATPVMRGAAIIHFLPRDLKGTDPHGGFEAAPYGNHVYGMH